MGIILTRFRRKKQTTLEVLEGLESKIKHIEEYRLSTEQRHRKIIAHLILYSVGLYVVATLLFYFYFCPASWNDILVGVTPLLVFPIIILFLKRLVSWYYHRKITSNQEKLIDMKNEKKKLLEEVMDKETYKVAKQILEKFAPDQLRRTSMTPVKPGLESSLALSPVAKLPTSPSPSCLSQRSVVAVGTTPPVVPILPSQGSDLRHRVVPKPPLMPSPGMQGRPGYVARESTTPSSLEATGKSLPPGPPMPRQILPRERGFVDKLMEYLVGDGPSNRYALICRQCESHNGMALKEEFEYLSFRCCYCFYWNPARKQRPQAPRLMPSSPGHTSASELESGSSTNEDEESEGESGSGSLVSQKDEAELPRENELPQESEQPPETSDKTEPVELEPVQEDVDVPMKNEDHENKDLESPAPAATQTTDL